MTGDEIVIVERVDERAFRAREKRDRRSVFQATSYGTGINFAPSARIRSIFAAGAVSIATTRARHARLSRRVGDALSGVAGADRPDAAGALRFGQHRDRVGRAAQFVGIDRLEIFELQADVGKFGSQFQPNERRADDGGGDPFARGANFGRARWGGLVEAG